jgi:hypothetical protein
MDSGINEKQRKRKDRHSLAGMTGAMEMRWEREGEGEGVKVEGEGRNSNRELPAVT